MLKVSKKSQYGLRAMAYLSFFYKEDGACSVKTISDKEDIPYDFLEKIISKLEKAGLVKSKKGNQGGYYLSRPPSQISVKDILSALEGKEPLVDCFSCSKSRRCHARNAWERIEMALDKSLESIKLSSI